jgi:hypothetical protein
MGKGWRNTVPKAKVERICAFSPEEEQVFKQIRLHAERSIRSDYSKQLADFRARHQYGYPSRPHYGHKTKRLLRMMRLMASGRMEAGHAQIELKNMKQM